MIKFIIDLQVPNHRDEFSKFLRGVILILKGRAILLNTNNVDTLPDIPLLSVISYSKNDLCNVYVEKELEKLVEDLK